MNAVIPLDYEGHVIRFDLQGWLNATDIAKCFGKEPKEWLRQFDTLEYMAALAECLSIKGVSETQLHEIKQLDSRSSLAKAKIQRLVKQSGMVRTVTGRKGGTWLHPKLAVFFARWLSARFAVWCDMQIDRLLRGEESFRQQIDAAILAAEKQSEKGSNAGRELALHRYRMPALIKHRDTLLDQAQIAINFGGQS